MQLVGFEAIILSLTSSLGSGSDSRLNHRQGVKSSCPSHDGTLAVVLFKQHQANTGVLLREMCEGFLKGMIPRETGQRARAQSYVSNFPMRPASS